MKFPITAFIITSLVLFTTMSSNIIKEEKSSLQTGTEGFVVLELFTSQGCSSCPPADNLLGKYAAMKNDHIIPLAFHVDYWNRLGWTDSFSSAKYSQRQRDYAMSIENSSVYTPQLIINGEKEFVGSDDNKISVAISNALKTKAAILISIDKIEKTGNKISVNYSLNKLQKNMTMQAALVQKKVFTNILKGENRGVKMTNYNVVRDFNSNHIMTGSSIASLHLPTGYTDTDFQVVLYIQDDASGKIMAVTQKSL